MSSNTEQLKIIVGNNQMLSWFSKDTNPLGKWSLYLYGRISVYTYFPILFANQGIQYTVCTLYNSILFIGKCLSANDWTPERVNSVGHVHGHNLRTPTRRSV